MTLIGRMALDWENELWVHFDKYRGRLNTRVIGHYYVTMLFVKYISDHWETSREFYRQLYKDNTELIQRKLGRERWVLEDDFSFDHIFHNRPDSGIGDIINITLTRIEQANWERLNGVFRHVDFNSEYDLGETRERNIFLTSLIELFGKLDLRPDRNQNLNEIIDNCLSIINMILVHNPGGGNFSTPQDICNLMTGLVLPEPGDSIYDPLCGSGGFLLTAAKKVVDEKGFPSPDYALYGQEKNKETWTLAKMNLYMHGLDSVYTACGDVITNPEWKENDKPMKFDIVLSNIPFSVDNWGIDQLSAQDLAIRFPWGTPPAKRGDYAFIEHILGSMNSNGKAGILVPQGALFREGKEQQIRKSIIDDNLLEAVIALPSNLFFYSAASCAILLFNRGRGKQKEVLFINATREFESGKRQNRLLDEHIEKITAAYVGFKNKKGEPAGDPAFCRIVHPDEIAALNYNLNVSRYFEGLDGPAADSIDTAALEKEIAELEKELTAIRKNLEKELKELKDLR